MATLGSKRHRMDEVDTFHKAIGSTASPEAAERRSKGIPGDGTKRLSGVWSGCRFRITTADDCVIAPPTKAPRRPPAKGARHGGRRRRSEADAGAAEACWFRRWLAAQVPLGEAKAKKDLSEAVFATGGYSEEAPPAPAAATEERPTKKTVPRAEDGGRRRAAGTAARGVAEQRVVGKENTPPSLPFLPKSHGPVRARRVQQFLTEHSRCGPGHDFFDHLPAAATMSPATLDDGFLTAVGRATLRAMPSRCSGLRQELEICDHSFQPVGIESFICKMQHSAGRSRSASKVLSMPLGMRRHARNNERARAEALFRKVDHQAHRYAGVGHLEVEEEEEDEEAAPVAFIPCVAPV